jgi:toxin ParE1/3/4
VARRLEVLSVALEEVLAATRWYLERDERVAHAYEAEISGAFELIERAPETWPSHHHDTHRVLLRRFPYEVIYKIYPDVVLIIAVAHCKRKPGYWRHR